jgi:hypothetical protein
LDRDSFAVVMEMLHRGGSDMDLKRVAGAWIAAAMILAVCLGVLSYLPGSGGSESASAQMNYTAPVRAGLPRSWYEATGSLPSETVANSDLDDGAVEADPPDPSEFDLAFGELIQ